MYVYLITSDGHLTQPFTNDFPRADIHQIIVPDILHQPIKGCFKDLVDWVTTYIYAQHPKREAACIMDDIDRRIAIVAPFAGLRHFPQGQSFKQWTGNDSKALMKVLVILSTPCMLYVLIIC